MVTWWSWIRSGRPSTDRKCASARQALISSARVMRPSLLRSACWKSLEMCASLRPLGCGCSSSSSSVCSEAGETRRNDSEIPALRSLPYRHTSVVGTKNTCPTLPWGQAGVRSKHWRPKSNRPGLCRVRSCRRRAGSPLLAPALVLGEFRAQPNRLRLRTLRPEQQSTQIRSGGWLTDDGSQSRDSALLGLFAV